MKWILLLGVVALACWGEEPISDAVPAGERSIALTRAYGGLEFAEPVAVVHVGDHADRAYVVEKRGRIVLVDRGGGDWSATEYLDITDRVNDRGNEEGLLGLAFDPEFDSNGYLYVYYTARGPRRTVVSRFSVDAGDQNRADARSETVILEVGQPYSNHNGGQVVFGPDGYLYIGLGDGGSGGDPRGNGQNVGTLLGTILRVDVSKLDTAGMYLIPADNPLVGVEGARPEIWAYGLRNPWRFTFDRLGGDLWAADVGQNAREEVDLIRPGLNYGWNVMEGSECYPQRVRSCDKEGLELPVVEYGRDDGCSITGGYVYRGERITWLQGRYIYGDYCSGKIWTFDRESGTSVELIDSRHRISSFAEGPDGELYVVSLVGGVYALVGK